MENDNLTENHGQQEIVQIRGRTVSRTPVQGKENKVTKQQILAVFILCYANLLNYMDRYTIAGKKFLL